MNQVCPDCNYVFLPLETTCPRCACSPLSAAAVTSLSQPPPANGLSGNPRLLRRRDALILAAVPFAALLLLLSILLLKGRFRGFEPIPIGPAAGHNSAYPGTPPKAQNENTFEASGQSYTPPTIVARSPAWSPGQPNSAAVPTGNASAAPSLTPDPSSPVAHLMLAPEPLPQPIPQLQGSAHIGGAQLSVENDGEGHETAVGRVLVVNDGPYEITDFRLGLKVNGLTYALVPFEGSLDFPTPILSRSISAGGSLDVPVATPGAYMSYFAGGVKYIDLEASLSGPPGIVTDETTVM